MATQPLPHDDDEPRTATLSRVGGAPTEALVAGTVGDRCVACGSPLSSDQRYCVVCGERRGAPRFSLPIAAAVQETVAATVPPRKPPRAARLGSGTTLVAGVATLLLAVLVGVLIGHNAGGGAKTTVTPGATKIIKINSGAAPAAASTTPAASGASSGAAGSPSSKASKGSKSKGAASKSGGSESAAKQPSAADQQQSAAQQSAASKVTGGSAGAPPTVTVGQKAAKGTPGVNKKTGKFDGSFFGG
jgi:hypothetical protein